MRKLLVLWALLAGLGLAQTFEYGMFTVAENYYAWQGEGTEGRNTDLASLYRDFFREEMGTGGLMAFFDALGRRGWELVSTESVGGDMFFFFRRLRS